MSGRQIVQHVGKPGLDGRDRAVEPGSAIGVAGVLDR
jgi:hypothetical protein